MATGDFAYAVSTGGSEVSSNTSRLVSWWSISKSVLAAAAIRLVDQRELALDMPFRDQPFTIRQMLQHTAGLRTYGGQAYREAVERRDPVWSVTELLDRVQANNLLFEPGHGWRYSNVGYIFVRQIIEEATQQNLSRALNTLIFEPLGMESTRLATTQNDMEETLWGNRMGYDPNWVYHGLLIGSARDAVTFLHGLLFTGFLSKQGLSEMMTMHRIDSRALEGRPWKATGYGLGLMMGEMKKVGRACGHSGVGHDTVSALYSFPDLPRPKIVATFAQGTDEGLTEHEAVRLASE